MSAAKGQHELRDAEDVKRFIKDHDLTHVNVAVVDVDGVLRSKRLSRNKLISAFDAGLPFCDVLFGWDSNDQLYDNVKFTGWHTGFPDAPVRLIPETCRELPFEENGILLLAELLPPGDAVCPRATLRRVLARLEGLGFSANCGFEYEFFLFAETPVSVREKHFRGLQPIAPGYFGYSGLRSLTQSELYSDILALCERMGFPLESLHDESGPGALEAAISVDDALRAADHAALFKTALKVFAQRRGLMATFMSRWSTAWPGQSGHVHLSLIDSHGRAAFHDESENRHISTTMRQFIAGQQALLPELLAMVAPTINSYRRLTPGYWAPTNATWGIENRTCALRAIPGAPSSQRVEYRIAPADANPYLAAAAAIGSGLWGIEHELEPHAPVEGNAYELSPDVTLPETLWDAAQALKGSSAALSLFGDAFVDHFAGTREWEEREFRKHVTDWELERYFETI